MKPSLQFRLSQHLALTPQLQQSIRLLQLSTLELHQEVEQMLEANPFLEPEEDAPTAYDVPSERFRVDAPKAGDDHEADAAGANGHEALGEVSAEQFGTTERDDWANGTERDDFDGTAELPALPATAGSAAAGGDDDDGFEAHERSAAHTSLADHLRAQLPGLRVGAADLAAIQVLIESLDADGYLADSLEEIAATLDTGLDEDDRDDLMSRLRCALHWLQRLDPPGVGARSLGECLSLQLRLRAEAGAECDEAALQAALVICDGQLDALARRDYKRLAAATGSDEAIVKRAQALICACEPKPGRPFADAESLVVVPDVVVQRSGRGLKVVLNPDVMPRLRINEVYAAAARGQRNGSHAAFSARLQEARWFVKNVQQRFDTILRVSTAIVERQRAFFTHGEIAMKPLVLREIADELGLHESTISRVTTAKYMATPLGTFELKYFFGSSLATEAGGNASSTAVRALIRQFVAAEDAKSPLSDSAIAQLLEAQGIQVARRTVAKYREGMKIAPAQLRKAS
jgi:RNA polymerase sigma-54 factor